MIYNVKNVAYSYVSGARKVLNNVSLRLEQGEILSILGPNGAGKSTLLNCMAGLLKPNRGSIQLDNAALSALSHRDIAKVVSYVPQNHTPTFAYTTLYFVMMGRAPHVGAFQKPSLEDEAVAMEALKALKIDHLANRPYTEISGGERQQATIARAIAQQPQAILFDEPTAHLDYGNQHRILRMIRALADQGYGVIITTHNPDHALLLGGKAAILDRDGYLSYGKCEEIITEERLKEVYETDLRLLYVEELGRVCCLALSLGGAEDVAG